MKRPFKLIFYFILGKIPFKVMVHHFRKIGGCLEPSRHPPIVVKQGFQTNQDLLDVELQKTLCDLEPNFSWVWQVQTISGRWKLVPMMKTSGHPGTLQFFWNYKFMHIVFSCIIMFTNFLNCKSFRPSLKSHSLRVPLYLYKGLRFIEYCFINYKFIRTDPHNRTIPV